MAEKNNPPFAIGQKVVCLVDAEILEKGDVVTVLNCFMIGCAWHIDCALISPITNSFVCNCGKKHVLNLVKGEPLYPEAKVFAPIQTMYADITAELAVLPISETSDTKITIVEEVKN